MSILTLTVNFVSYFRDQYRTKSTELLQAKIQNCHKVLLHRLKNTSMRDVKVGVHAVYRYSVVTVRMGVMVVLSAT